MRERVLVGICAYNEENNISNLLENLILQQDMPGDYQILIVCSGSTDRTSEIIGEFQTRDDRIRIMNESTRKGKASALNRIFDIAAESSDILVLVNADTIPAGGSVMKLVSELSNGNAGAVFARPIPREGCNSFSYGIVKLIWHMHHLISVYREPKLSGELCAIRTVFLNKIPSNVATDEPYIELGIRTRGGRIVYVSDSTVKIRCPTTSSDLLKQRTRIWIGHMQLKNETGFKVPTTSFGNMLQTALSLERSEIPYLFGGAIVEMLAYIRANVEMRTGRIPFAWEPIKSTKTSTLI